MQKMKKYLPIIFIIFLLTSIMANGAINSKEIEAILKNVTIKTENSCESVEVLFHRDHIYLPLRLTAKALNTPIEWHGESQRVDLYSPDTFHDFPEADPWLDERFVYGEIVDINKENLTLTIEQHIDDNSIYLEPEISLSSDVIIILQRNNKKMNIDFDDLYFGEYVGIVLNPDGKARGIILNS